MNIDCGSMSDQQIQDIADRLTTALEGLAPGASGWWVDGLALACIAILVAAAFVTVLAPSLNWKGQRVSSHARFGVAPNLRWQRDSYPMKEWRRRADWALNASTSANDKMFSYGVAVLSTLAKSSHAGPGDKAVFDAVWKASNTGMQDKEILGLLEQLQGGDPQHSRFPSDDIPAKASDQPSAVYLKGSNAYSVLRREIQAARLKVVLDEQLDRKTSPAVQHLSTMKLPLLTWWTSE